MDLLVKKRHDYGSNFKESWKEFGMISAVIRISDKVNRLKNLAKKGLSPQNESVIDSFKDIIGYSLLSLRLLLKGEGKTT